MTNPDGGLFGTGSIAENYRAHLEGVIFEPWAEPLVAFCGLQPGDVVLDVAAGTGAATRTAAKVVGVTGRVIASDLSEDMLARVVRDDEAATIETLVCSAMELDLVAGSVDGVVCQQGLQFFPDPDQALAEMRRVLRPGGRVAVAVWRTAGRIDPFQTYGEVLLSSGVEEPFPRAFDMTRFTMAAERVGTLLGAAGFAGVEVVEMDLTLRWPGPGAAAVGVTGTPFVPALESLPPDRQREVMAAMEKAFASSLRPDGSYVSSAVLGRGSA